MAVRLKDIADDLGVSLVTVSKVLRNHPDVGQKTRDRVLQRVREMNYRPNLAARSLVTGQTFNIGLIVPDLVHSFFAHVAKGATPVLRNKDYNLVISSSEEDEDLERHETEQLIARGVDALMIASAQVDPEYFARLDRDNIPYVLIDREIHGLPTNFVGADNEAIGHLATRHLVEVGCKRIAHIGGSEISTAVGRQRGFLRALAEAGIEGDPRYLVHRKQIDRIADVSGFQAMQSLLALSPPPDGVFCFNDPTAVGAMKAILHAGLRIPEDVAVVGSGNVRHTDFFRVPLTTVEQSSEEIGTKAAALALELAVGRKRKAPKRILIEPTLVVRESTRR